MISFFKIKIFYLKAAYSPVQLNANGQATLLPMITNGFHSPHHSQNIHIQQTASAIFDPSTSTLLHQVGGSNVSPGIGQQTGNPTNNPGLLPLQQRTDRLQVC